MRGMRLAEGQKTCVDEEREKNVIHYSERGMHLIKAFKDSKF